MYYKDKSGHFTTKENNGGKCPHNKYNNTTIDELKGITQKEYRQNTKYEELRMPTIVEKVPQNNENTELDLIMGREYKGFKGQAAVNKLLEEKNGHIKAAFHREDFGDIDLLWGNENLGLCHIITRREEQGIDTNVFLKDITEVIEQGNFRKKNQRGNFEFMHGNKIAVIAPEYKGKKLVFLLTAFKTHSKK